MSRVLLAALFLCVAAACSNPSRQTARVITAQAPGSASGSGSTLVGPTNSAASSTQVAERTTVWAPPPTALATPFVSAPTIPSVTTPLPPSSLPIPVWTTERTSTTLGSHQDATGLLKAAQVASGWPAVRWIGIICVILCIGGLLHSHNNPDTGYPLVWIKVGISGVILIIIGDNPWMLLLLSIPVGFYLLQKLGLIRLPLP